MFHFILGLTLFLVSHPILANELVSNKKSCDVISETFSSYVEDVKKYDEIFMVNDQTPWPAFWIFRNRFLDAFYKEQIGSFYEYHEMQRAIRRSYSADDKRYDKLPQVSNYQFPTKKSCSPLSDIRYELREYKNVALPVIPSNLKKEVTIAVIDTGIDLKNPFLTKRITIPKGARLNDLNFSNEKSLQDTHSHGSHVTGLILAVFPYAKILPLKVNEITDDKDRSLAKALRYAVDQRVDIINFSGGGHKEDSEELAVLKEAERKGIIVVVAAGNYNADITVGKDTDKRDAYYPASYVLTNKIVVGNLDKENKTYIDSNYGQAVDIAAYGVYSRSYALNPYRKNCVDNMTGTSQATPLVTGALAIIMATRPDLSPMEARKLVLDQAKSIDELKQFVKDGKVLQIKNIASVK